MYPNFAEMGKYTGVVSPRNFEVFRERLARNGMLHQADDFSVQPVLIQSYNIKK